MTFSRLFGTFAIALTVSSLAAAQQPSPATPQALAPAAYVEPQQPQAASPSQPAYATPPQVNQYYGYGAPQVYYPAAPAWAMSAKDGKLLIESADGGTAACADLTIPVEGGAAVEVTVEGKTVHVRSGKGECGVGKCCRKESVKDSLVGSALKVSRGGFKGYVLTLEGEAKLTLVRQGKKAELTADRISVNLATGQIEGQIGHPPQNGYAPQYAPVWATPTPVSAPAVVPSTPAPTCVATPSAPAPVASYYSPAPR
jgi:hypothetical protein